MKPSKRKILVYFPVLLSFLFPYFLSAQSVEIKKFYDPARKVIKESYFVKSRTNKTLHGGYKSYYINGNLKAKGAYKDNLPNGYWEYYYENKLLKSAGNLDENEMEGLWKYYFENGNLNMEGHMTNGIRIGFWKFYYESGELKMEGNLKGDNKEGHWKYYYEDGKLKGDAFFKANKGLYKEYYTNGKVSMEGSIIDGKSDSLWRYYHENGVLKAEGYEKDGLKTGNWTFYHENGAKLSEGNYTNGITNGNWKYFHPNGTLSAEGEEKEGQKEGYWKLYYENTALKGEGKYSSGEGEYKEYYESGKLKASGFIKDGKNEGKWIYYYESGATEANVDFVSGEGQYTGYYEDGRLKMEGVIKDNKKIGVWKLYDQNGTLAGYYKTFYNNTLPQFEKIPDTGLEKDSMIVYEKPDIKIRKRKSRYFTAKHNEFTSFIVSTNPSATIFGSIPLGVEFYIQERLGVEFVYTYIRDPFFISDNNIDLNKLYNRGYSTALRLKLYKPDQNLGMFYFCHELRYSSADHFSNIIDSATVNVPFRTSLKAKETKMEYSFIMGNRFMKYANKSGFTIDVFLGLGVGYRHYKEMFPETFENNNIYRNINKSKLSVPLRMGISFGYAF